ncbi:hypothetical protein C9374_008805 [Naegleria lovaniensis]|uniref:Uncharacterized protein n=1 Tax=Naegleria lovaniensis TaxID=51637 RepID=A0AA88GJ28_NAELO|nr:uncharacterized protein C9374_008805 [Naegleria lovaniensis]KAG2377720.1 hypothetical protein C9374_008805 [Naegleria lovaniensis]
MKYSVVQFIPSSNSINGKVIMTQQTEAVSSCGGLMQFDISCNFHTSRNLKQLRSNSNDDTTTPAAFFYWKEASSSPQVSKKKNVSVCMDLQKLNSNTISQKDSRDASTTKQPKVSKPNKMKNRTSTSPKTLSFIDVSPTMTSGIQNQSMMTSRKRRTQSYEQVLNLNHAQPMTLPLTTSVSCSTQQSPLHTTSNENMCPSIMVDHGSYVHQQSLCANSQNTNNSSVNEIPWEVKSPSSSSCQSSDCGDSKSKMPNKAIKRSYIFSIKELLN